MKETKLQSELEKRLQTENVMCMGFGLAYKSVMLDREISAQAKCLYLTICAYAGNDAEAYPSRGALLRDTGLSYAAYYTALRELQDSGLIRIRKVCRGDKHYQNGYEVIQRPVRYFADSSAISGTESDLKSLGTGLYPKTVACDTRLHPRAKALYGLLVTLADDSSDRSACPYVEDIKSSLGIGDTAYYSACCELKDCGYLTIQKMRVGNHLGANRYLLREFAT